MARMDFGSIQKAIDDAFQTYWRVRESREARGESEKERQAAMMRQQFGDTAAAERIRLTGEQERLTRGKYPEQFGPSKVNVNAESAKEERERKEAVGYQKDRLQRKVDGLTEEILSKIDDEKWNWKKIKDTYSKFFGEEVESWQWKKMQTDPLLAQDFVKKNVAKAVLRAYTNNEFRDEMGVALLYGQDLDSIFAPWIDRKVNWGEKPKEGEIIPLRERVTPMPRPMTSPTGQPLPSAQGAGMPWTLPQGGGMPLPKLR